MTFACDTTSFFKSLTKTKENSTSTKTPAATTTEKATGSSKHNNINKTNQLTNHQQQQQQHQTQRHQHQHQHNTINPEKSSFISHSLSKMMQYKHCFHLTSRLNASHFKIIIYTIIQSTVSF